MSGVWSTERVFIEKSEALCYAESFRFFAGDPGISRALIKIATVVIVGVAVETPKTA